MNIDMDKVPLTIEESLNMFSSSLTEEEKTAFLDVKENQLCIFHYTWGTFLRNVWSMHEKNTPLVNDFLKLGINHADDITAIIFISTYRKFKNKPIEMDKQVEKIKKHWLKEIGREMP